jgi:fructose-1,6-bisphosphatase/inositol monophosphatase family enzyme
VEDKGGGAGLDPVTEADRSAERAMRALVAAEHPSHGVVGEELSPTECAARPARPGRFLWRVTG